MYIFLTVWANFSSLDHSNIQQILSLTNIRSNVYSYIPCVNVHYFLTASKKLEATNTWEGHLAFTFFFSPYSLHYLCVYGCALLCTNKALAMHSSKILKKIRIVGNIKRCKMHDIVHDFAQSITKNEWLDINDDKR